MAETKKKPSTAKKQEPTDSVDRPICADPAVMKKLKDADALRK